MGISGLRCHAGGWCVGLGHGGLLRKETEKCRTQAHKPTQHEAVMEHLDGDGGENGLQHLGRLRFMQGGSLQGLLVAQSFNPHAGGHVGHQ